MSEDNNKDIIEKVKDINERLLRLETKKWAWIGGVVAVIVIVVLAFTVAKIDYSSDHQVWSSVVILCVAMVCITVISIATSRLD